MKVRTLAKAGVLVIVTAGSAAGQEIKHFGDVWNEASGADKLVLVEASDTWRNTLEPNLRLNGSRALDVSVGELEELIDAERERVVLGVDMVYMDSAARILDIEVAVVLAGAYGREYMIAPAGSHEERTALARFTCEVRVATIASREVRGDMGFYATVALPAGTLNAQADAIRERRGALSDQHCRP